MGKKSKRTRSKQTSGPVVAPDTRLPPSHRTEAPVEEETLDNLRFEDPYVEEYEVEDYDKDYDEEDQVTRMKTTAGSAESAEIVQSWNPLTGEALQAGEQLEMDPSAYKMHHAVTPEWPALSFDFVRDDIGESRTRFPHSLIAAIGTQANRPESNSLTLLKISDLSKMQIETEDDVLGDELNPERDDDEEEESEDEIDLDPTMEHYSIPHQGGVNRLRVMPQQPDIIATFSETGHVNLFNVEAIRQRFSIQNCKGPTTSFLDIPTKPFFCYEKHQCEGFALDWSPVQQGHLATGDCSGSIHIWSPPDHGSGYNVSTFYQTQKQSSIEDLQWSPSEANVFASAECGGTVRIFDTRAPNKAMLSHQIHLNNADVNVLSWNKLVTNLLATGGDDGTLSVWDLRHFASLPQPKPLARFTPHKTPITSVEWHPTDESMLAASDDVGAYIYDLSVEEDDNAVTAGPEQLDVPPQLLFVHCGSDQFKEIHWHPQISSCLMTTALTGFSMFIPSNL